MSELKKTDVALDFAHYAVEFIKEKWASTANEMLAGWGEASGVAKSNRWAHTHLRQLEANGILIRSPRKKGAAYTYNLAVRNGDTNESR